MSKEKIKSYIIQNHYVIIEIDLLNVKDVILVSLYIVYVLYI